MLLVVFSLLLVEFGLVRLYGLQVRASGASGRKGTAENTVSKNMDTFNTPLARDTSSISMDSFDSTIDMPDITFDTLDQGPWWPPGTV